MRKSLFVIACILVANFMGCQQAPQTREAEAAAIAQALPLSPDNTPDRVSLPGTTGTQNVIVIVSDDQRYDTMFAMPKTMKHLGGNGVTFTNAVVSTTICCPSRSGFLTGYSAQHTGVLTNTPLNGGVSHLDDNNTLATRLQAIGVTTGLIGKYANGYAQIIPYVPPGWSYWRTSLSLGEVDFNNYTVVSGASTGTATVGTVADVHQYETEWIQERALEFLQTMPEPFYLYITPHLPHLPSTPAPQYAGAYGGYYARPGAWRSPREGKPTDVVNAAPYDIAEKDIIHQMMLESLISIDDLVHAIWKKLSEQGRLGRTTIVYTSDNGYLFGEFNLTGKSYPYDPSIRVPLLVYAPGVHPRTDSNLVYANLDVPALVLSTYGLAVGDGADLMPLLLDARYPWRDTVFLEYFNNQSPVNIVLTWVAARTHGYKMIKRAIIPPQRELYDLVADPYEMRNVVDDPTYASIRESLGAFINARRGLAILEQDMPAMTVGIPYSMQIVWWGGSPPYALDTDGTLLPPGLTLSTEGLLSGTPEISGSYVFRVRVTDSSVSPQSGRPQVFIREFSAVIP